ncbi:MAG: porin [Pirellulales bacterium]
MKVVKYQIFSIFMVAILAFSSQSRADYGCTAGCDQNGSDCGCDAADNKSCGCDADSCGCESDCCGWCNLGEAWKLQQCENCSRITYGGWASFGYHSDPTPLSAAYGDGLAFNDVPNQVNLHQGYFHIGREADGQGEWDWGFQVDVLYGTDAQKTQAFGQPNGWDTGWDNGVYGWALPQAYVSLDQDDLSIKVGHFYTIIGYEVVTAPGNFFYSHAFTMFNSEPFTHTGILASYDVYDDVTVYGGWTAGWDTGFESFRGGSNFLGGVSVPLLDDLTMAYMVTIGDMGARGRGYSHSFVFDWTINENWEYVLQSDLVALEADAFNGGFGNDQYGVNQYLFYTVNDCVKAGVRAEWWNSDNTDAYGITAGLNIRPHANLIFRPEVRYDTGNLVVNDGSIFGVDAILTF